MSSSSSFLSNASATAASLASLVRSAFGPGGRDKLCVSAVGHVLLTCSGEAILRHMAPEPSAAAQQQPAAKLIKDAVAAHALTAGDGSAAFMIALSEALAAAESFTREDEQHAGADASGVASSLSPSCRRRRLRLLRSLDRVHRHWVMGGALERWLVAQHGRAIPRRDTDAVRAAVTQMARTMLSHQLSPAAVNVLSEAVATMLSSAVGYCSDGAKQSPPLHDVCAALLSDFPFVLCAQLPLSDTRLLNGFLIPAKVALRSMPTSVQGGAFVVLHCTLHAVPLAHEARAAHLVLEAQTEQQRLAFLTEGERVVERWVRRFQAEGIRLVLCSYKLHDSALSMLSAAGIAVLHCLDEFDTRRLAHYSGASPITSMGAFEARFDPSTQRDIVPPLPVGQLGAFTQIMVGAQPMAHVELQPGAANPMCASGAEGTMTTSTPPVRIRPFTLLLCGASEGMCKQYESMLHRCLRMLQDCSRSSAAFERSIAEELNGGAAVPSLYTLGGGWSAELSLMLFCDAQTRLLPHAPQDPHPLLPVSSVADEASVDLTPAFSVLSASLSGVVRALLANALPTTCEPGAEDAAPARRGEGAPVPWIKMMPHMRCLYQESGVRNLGFVMYSVVTPPPYAPLYRRIVASPSAQLKEDGATLDARRIRVAQAELALGSMMPPLFMVADVEAGADPLRESVASKVALLSGVLSALMILLRVEAALPARRRDGGAGTLGGGAGTSIAALNRPGGLFAQGTKGKRVKSRSAWEEEESDSAGSSEEGSSDDDIDEGS